MSNCKKIRDTAWLPVHPWGRMGLRSPGEECPLGPHTGVQGSLSSSVQASPRISSSGWHCTVKCFPNPCVLDNIVQQAHSTRKLRCTRKLRSPEAALTTEHLSYTATLSSLSSYTETCFFALSRKKKKNMTSFWQSSSLKSGLFFSWRKKFS